MKLPRVECNLEDQGFPRGACGVKVEGESLPACTATLREEEGRLERLITSVHLSRPENYLSIYQSGCNLSCRKCHSWEFSQHAKGTWMSPDDIARKALEYAGLVTLAEPRERATAWHAHDSCRCCGYCVVYGERAEDCPGRLAPEDILLSPQGFGPGRNIVAFTGGDVSCRPGFYESCARKIKEITDLWVLIETNGYGLTPGNLDALMEAGVDAFWLDIKAHDSERHRWLTGAGNDRILGLPGEMLERGFVVEVLSLFIPGLVDAEELGRIARVLARTDVSIPFTILAFFPEHRMKETRPPTAGEMVEAYRLAREEGLENVRLGNLGVFVKTREDLELLTSEVDPRGF